MRSGHQADTRLVLFYRFIINYIIAAANNFIQSYLYCEITFQETYSHVGN